MDFAKSLDASNSLSEIFEVVKRVVQSNMGQLRAGLMLGLADLGNHPAGFVGAFYPVASNVIVMNKVPLKRIKDTNPDLYKPYAFNVLLHEYLHTLGYLEERTVRRIVLKLSQKAFGDDHLTTKIAKDYSAFFPNLVYPEVAWQPAELSLEIVRDFDRSNVSYIG